MLLCHFGHVRSHAAISVGVQLERGAFGGRAPADQSLVGNQGAYGEVNSLNGVWWRQRFRRL